MFRPTYELQLCAGASMVLLSCGGAWSMVSGAVVQFRVAGANFSVNQKLEQVESITEVLEQTTTQLKQEPKVNHQRLREVELQLQAIEPEITKTELEIHQELDSLVDSEAN